MASQGDIIFKKTAKMQYQNNMLIIWTRYLKYLNIIIITFNYTPLSKLIVRAVQVQNQK
jgi:hypothetical protein